MVRIGIIGAGPAGLCVARNAKARGHCVSIWEQTAEIGGTWVYSPRAGGPSSMYEEMLTNLPKEVMAFPDCPFPESLPSFIRHQDVLEYIREYGRDVAVSLSSRVQAVERKADGWKITVEDSAGHRSTETVGAVFVCNGHYSEPNQPFDTSKFTKGSIIHSHDYRHPRRYKNETVVVIGAGPSGIDIALQIAEAAQKVILVGRQAASYKGCPPNLELLAEPVQQITHNGVQTQHRELNCDHIVVCTGYFYNFPFFDEALVTLRENKRYVSRLFEHLVHADYPTELFFVGLPFTVVPFILFQAQTEYALALLEKKVRPPSIADYEESRLSKAKFLSDHGLPLRMYHCLGDTQWAYFERLLQLAKCATPVFTQRVRELYNRTAEQRLHNVQNYKRINFKQQ